MTGRNPTPHRPHHGESVEWYTPPEIFEALGIHFDLDPCSPLSGPVPWIPVRRFLTARENGLTAPWGSGERVWLNPPYWPDVERWIQRLACHGNGIALVFARTDTPWWHEAATAASAVCFIKGRLHFVRLIDGEMVRHQWNAGAPSCLLAYGHECAAAVARSGLGLVFRSEARIQVIPPLLEVAS